MIVNKLKGFINSKPRVLILDDSDISRRRLNRSFRNIGFETEVCSTVEEFDALWSPGMFDVIVADWDLAETSNGDEVLVSVRQKDWDVPFVLISGQLEENTKRSDVLLRLLSSSGSRFVERGDDGFEKVCEAAIELIGRRDLVLLKLILKFRRQALAGHSIETTSGAIPVKTLLAEIVKDTNVSFNTEEPLANRIAEKLSREI